MSVQEACERLLAVEGRLSKVSKGAAAQAPCGIDAAARTKLGGN